MIRQSTNRREWQEISVSSPIKTKHSRSTHPAREISRDPHYSIKTSLSTNPDDDRSPYRELKGNYGMKNQTCRVIIIAASICISKIVIAEPSGLSVNVESKFTRNGTLSSDYMRPLPKYLYTVLVTLENCSNTNVENLTLRSLCKIDEFGVDSLACSERSETINAKSKKYINIQEIHFLKDVQFDKESSFEFYRGFCMSPRGYGVQVLSGTNVLFEAYKAPITKTEMTNSRIFDIAHGKFETEVIPYIVDPSIPMTHTRPPQGYKVTLTDAEKKEARHPQEKRLEALLNRLSFSNDADRQRFVWEIVEVYGETVAARGITLFDGSGGTYGWPRKSEPTGSPSSSGRPPRPRPRIR